MGTRLGTSVNPGYSFRSLNFLLLVEIFDFLEKTSLRKTCGIYWPDSIKKNENFLVSRVRVLLYVIEADEFSYRCLISRNDGPARQSRNESALFPKNIPSNILTFHSEGGVFSTCGFFHMIEEGLKGTPFKFRHKIFTTSGRKKFMKIK